MRLQETIKRIKFIIDEQYKSEESRFTCQDCKNYDYNMYMVNDEIWNKFGNKDGTLCMKCLETRMGRKLIKKDFEQYKNAKANLNNPEVQKILKMKNLNEQIYRIKQMMGIKESDDIVYTNPDFDIEWDEAKRYIDHPNPNKKINWTYDEWIDKVKTGKVMKFSELENLENITDPEEFDDLFPEKVERFINSFSRKKIELPIAVKLPNGTYDLIAGNTRVTGLRGKGYDPKIWVFNI